MYYNHIYINCLFTVFFIRPKLNSKSCIYHFVDAGITAGINGGAEERIQNWLTYSVDRERGQKRRSILF